jgi:hypothetical protein
MTMQIKEDERALMNHLESLDRWLHDDEGGAVPLQVLRERGLEIPDDDTTLDDASLHSKLWEVLEAMADIGMVVEFTDHLSDRALYRYLVRDCLPVETYLSEFGLWHVSPVDELNYGDVYMRYYADDVERATWAEDTGDPLPPREPRAYDRDRLLPGGADHQR